MKRILILLTSICFYFNSFASEPLQKEDFSAEFKKLNTLVSAQVNDLTSKLPSLGGKGDVNRQVTDLRERVNTAMAHEESLRTTVLTLRDEIAALQFHRACASGARHAFRRGDHRHVCPRHCGLAPDGGRTCRDGREQRHRHRTLGVGPVF